MAEPDFIIYPQVSTSIPALAGFVDGYPVEEHRLGMSSTGHPLESGSEITDHAVQNRKQLRLEGLVSDLLPMAGVELTPGRSGDAWGLIVSLFEDRRPVDVVTAIYTYTGMLVSRAVATVNGSTGRALKFTIHFQELLLAETTIERFPPPLISPFRTEAKGRTGKKDAGERVSPTEAPASAASSTPN